MMKRSDVMTKLMLTADRIRAELFTGGFRPMKTEDFYGFSDAEPGSLIADIAVGRFSYVVIFTPSLGNVQIFETTLDGESFAWEMDLFNDSVIEL